MLNWECIDSKVQSQEGPLNSDEELQFTFKTAPYFGVVNEKSPIPADNTLSFEFNQPLTIEPELAWTPLITPNIAGKWQVVNNRSTLVFTPDVPWSGSTKYVK